MGNCFKSTAASPTELKAAKGDAAKPIHKWSWDTEASRKWKQPSKEAFFSKFREEGEENLSGARSRFCDGKIPGKETKGVHGTAERREVRVWRPGDLDGYELQIQGHKYVDFYCLDLSGQITVDDCEHCRFFLAPCEGSTFFRGCHDCKFITACAQLRMYNCHRSVLMVHVPGRVNVESCKSTTVSGWNVGYFELAQQMARAKLSVWNNAWWRSHDFGSNSIPKLLPATTTAQEIMGSDWAPPGDSAGVSGFGGEEVFDAAGGIPRTMSWE
eukprot:Hpha_TRINITY_DN10227_c0_g2::TRINITY_DN10227_c0_g2_i1::g.34907::m.34907/K18272/RP2; protein XRP2